jgi:hypothetical protein
MGDGVGFKETWTGLAPLVGFDRYLLSQKGPWFVSGSTPLFILDWDRVEKLVNGGSRDTL